MNIDFWNVNLLYKNTRTLFDGIYYNKSIDILLNIILTFWSETCALFRIGAYIVGDRLTSLDLIHNNYGVHVDIYDAVPIFQ